MRSWLNGWSALAGLVTGALVGCQCGDDFGIAKVPGTVEAVLCDPVTGLPAAGQVLRADAKDGAYEQGSAADGRAVLSNVPSGELVIHIQHRLADGTLREDHQASATLEERATLTLLDPACVAVAPAAGKGAIQGQVCNRHTGQLLTNAEVTAVAGSGETHATTSDAGGFFAMRDVSAGDYAVTVRSAGFQRTYPVHVEAGDVAHLDLGANCHPFDPTATGNLGGKLCATNGSGPWALAVVSVSLPDGSARQDLTDGDGNFLVEGIPPGTYDVSVQGGGEWATYSAAITAGQTTRLTADQDCPVPPRDQTGDVRGQLCDRASGGWLVGALAKTRQGGRDFLDHTDERGRFHLAGLAPGIIVISVDKNALHREFQTPVTAGATVLVVDGQCAPATGECRDEDKQVADAAPLRILLVVDKSGSMADPGLDGNKWFSSVNALKAVTAQLETEAAFGLALFPAGISVMDQCGEGVMEVAPAVNNAPAIAAQLDASEPGGGTPTGATLLVVRQWLTTHPSETTSVVILATDGVPNCNESLNPDSCVCPDSGCQGDARACLDDQETLSAIGAVAALGVRTYVIGLPGSGDPTEVLRRMAEAGGTTTYYQPSSTAGLTADMTSIVVNNRTCRFELDGTPNDPQRVEVLLDGNSVPRDPARRLGWDLVGTHGVELYGAPCRQLRGGVGHTLRVHYCVD